MIGSPSKTLKLRIDRVVAEAIGVLSFDLVDPDGAELPPWEPGAHVEVTVSEQFRRQYSLCGELQNPYVFRIGVLDAPDGRGGSRHIHEHWRVGDVVEVSQPRNHFGLVDQASRYTFIAGGIGITPILSMVRSLDARGIPATVHYGGRCRESMAFVSALENLPLCDLAVIEQDKNGLPDLEKIVRSSPEGSYIYCCGPRGMIEAVERIVEGHAGNRYHLRTERFSAGGDAGNDLDPANSQAFTVELRRSGSTVEVEDNVSILDAVRVLLPDVVSSCEEGICGSCEVRVLRGTVDHRDHILTDEQRSKSETMMICVSRSKSDVLVLDL